MTQKALKLLERMRRSKAGWKRRELDQLYESFGFIITHGSNHDIVKHPKYPQLRATLPRHTYLAKGYVEFAIKMIDDLLTLEKQESHSGSAETS